jgi:hypothetical protein
MQPRTPRKNITKRGMVTIFFTGAKLLVLNALPDEQKFNQNHFLAMIAPNSSRKTRTPSRELVRTNWSYTWRTSCAVMGATFESTLPGKQ